MDTVTKVKPEPDSLVAYKTLHNEKGEVTDYVIPVKVFEKYILDKEAEIAYLRSLGSPKHKLEDVLAKLGYSE